MTDDLFQMYIAYHSYGEKIIYPWSYSGKKVPDWQELHAMGAIMGNKIFEESKGKYKYLVTIITFPLQTYLIRVRVVLLILLISGGHFP